MKEEHILMSVPTEGECPVELLTQWELELRELEDWLDSPEPEGGCQEIAMPEETHQHKEQLVEVGMEPAEELTGVNLSGEVVAERNSSVIEVYRSEDATEWQVKTMRDERRQPWEISVIYPKTREKCSKLVCNRRTNRWSSWMKWLRR
jgi:hypothetical protein